MGVIGTCEKAIFSSTSQQANIYSIVCHVISGSHEIKIRKTTILQNSWSVLISPALNIRRHFAVGVLIKLRASLIKLSAIVNRGVKEAIYVW